MQQSLLGESLFFTIYNLDRGGNGQFPVLKGVKVHAHLVHFICVVIYT